MAKIFKKYQTGKKKGGQHYHKSFGNQPHPVHRDFTDKEISGLRFQETKNLTLGKGFPETKKLKPKSVQEVTLPNGEKILIKTF
mgnify:CR=1 FL=1